MNNPVPWSIKQYNTGLHNVKYKPIYLVDGNATEFLFLGDGTKEQLELAQRIIDAVNLRELTQALKPAKV